MPSGHAAHDARVLDAEGDAEHDRDVPLGGSNGISTGRSAVA